MTTITNHSEYTAAVNEAKLHDYRYFTLNAPTITDEEYDRLYFAIQDYETAHPDETLADSPTQSAHAEVKNGHKQIRRRTEMLSTEKAQTIEKVQKWMKKTTKKTGEGLYTVEWKYDGISLSLVYIDGQLTEASYGKGMEGNDCLQHCLKVASIPDTISPNDYFKSVSGRVEVRGEMVVPFANLKKTGYKNCRSAAAGIMADTASTLTDCLEFHPYYIDGATMFLSEHEAEGSCMEHISSLGFLHTNNSILHDEDDVERDIKEWEKTRSEQPFPTDGLVIKVDDRTKWDTLGRNDHHPHYAIAYKFAAATAETTVTCIEITVGKTGKRTPVAYFEPITINGATYQKASVGSEAKLAELGIEVGSRVIVSLRNDVIPHIEKKTLSDPLPDPLPLKGEGVDTTLNETSEPRNIEEEPCVIAEPEIEATPCKPCMAVADTDIDPIAEYLSPATSIEPTVSETLCAPVIESVTNYRPRREPKRKYRMVGDAPSTPAMEEAQPKRIPWYVYLLIVLAIVALAVLCYAGLGAVVFLLPLLAGAFK